MTNITELKNWRVFATIAGGIHFAGYRLADDRPYVSPAIVFFDSVCRTGVTRTGAAFLLLGRHAVSQLDVLVAPYVAFDKTLSRLLDLSDIYANGFKARPIARPVRISAGLRATWHSDHALIKAAPPASRCCAAAEAMGAPMDCGGFDRNGNVKMNENSPSRCSMLRRSRGVVDRP